MTIRRRLAAGFALAVACGVGFVLTSGAMATEITPAIRSELAPSGKLRVGLNHGNFLLVTPGSSATDPKGVASDIARELGRRVGVPVEFIKFDTAGKLGDGVKTGAWDVAFLGNEPQRAAEIAFSAAYLEIPSTYLVPAGSPIRSIAEVDREGVRIAVAEQSAYGLRAEGKALMPERLSEVWLETNRPYYGDAVELPVDAVLSSIPLVDLVLSLDPLPPQRVVTAAARLRYRDLCLVALIIDDETPFPDNWIYLHDPGTRAGRVQNFGAWSPGMVRPGATCLGVEYFCFEGDEIWELPDTEAVELAKRELGRIGLVDPARVVDGVKVRVPRAYPMYDSNYQEALPVVREYLRGFENLRTCGRNGLHRYNNQDHSMWTAILATLDLLDGGGHDVWSVNTDAEYHEEGAIVEGLLDVELVA